MPEALAAFVGRVVTVASGVASLLILRPRRRPETRLLSLTHCENLPVVMLHDSDSDSEFLIQY